MTRGLSETPAGDEADEGPMPGLDDPQFLEPLRRMGIVLSTGEWDICREANVRLSDILTRKEIAHWLDVRPGAVHDWPVWRETFPLYISKIVRL